MKIIQNLLKDARDEWLVQTTATINNVNPIVDRIMDDDSVEGVIMTNNEGAPILTNLSLVRATNFGLTLQCLGNLAQTSIKEVDSDDNLFNFVPPNKEADNKKEKKLNLQPINKKRKSPPTVFSCIKKRAPGWGGKLVKIEIHDLNNLSDSSACDCNGELCIQYIVRNDCMDSIYDSVKEIIVQISDSMK